jgi:putative transposase
MKQLALKRKRLARQFSKTKKRSSNRNKARIKLARLDEKIANTRNDFGWKLCRTLVKKYGTIFAEDLSIKNMQKNHNLAGAITDVSWADFMQKLSFKAESAGGKVMKVNPKNTSQKCSRCGEIVEKEISTRKHKCPNCKLEMDRDTNAARNILTIGKIGQELPESSLLEMMPLLMAQARQQASSMKQEAPCESWG